MIKEQRTSTSLIGAFRDAGLTIKGIACIVILTFGGLVTSPAFAAVKQEVQKIQWRHPDNKAAELSNTLKGVHTLLDNLQLTAPVESPATTETIQAATAPTAFTAKQADAFKAARKQLKAYHDQLKTLDQDTLAQFASVKQHLIDHHLPQVILDREAKAEATYKERMVALMTELNAANVSKDNATFQQHVLKMKTQLDQQMKEHPKTHFDPNNLPNRSLKPNLKRKPFTTKKQFAEAGFISNPYIQVASLTNNFDISHMPSAQDPAYLAATTEVTLSPAIKAKAAALNYNPVEIYNWVRNNVVWQPTWGAVQDADLTLSAQRGNAFDISSLLIALLRASGIPARYVQGTINVPEAKFRNWAGGFQNINAAMEYASSGGIPIAGVVNGGKITTVQMEHIWVEAAVDYFPSRGVKNISANTWVPLDASYKQYTFQQGLNLPQISGVDSNSVAQQYFESGTIDNTNDYISGLNASIVQNAEQTAMSNVQNYITQNLPNATWGDVIGGASIVASNSSVLAAGLRNSVVIVGARYGTLPATLEQSISFALGVNELGEPNKSKTFPWPQLNNQQVILSFQPATAADLQALKSLLPSGQITDISQLPTSIAAYLINVVPELKVNGQVVMSGDSMTLGQELTFVFTPQLAGRQALERMYNVTAGSYLDIGVIAGNVSPALLSSLRQSIQQSQSILQTQNPAGLSTLTRENVLGNLFQAGMLGYYAQYIDNAYVLGLSSGGHEYLAAGTGSFGYEPKVDSIFGVPQDIRGSAVVFNLPITNVFSVDSTDQSKLVEFAFTIGLMSSKLESTVPEQLFSTAAQPLTAVSATAVLSEAAAAGQRIYEIDQSNESTVLPLIHHNPEVLQEIADAISAGKDVITHTDDITVSGWTGAGYIIVDPATGYGAYKIGGGQNGGVILAAVGGLMMVAAILLPALGALAAILLVMGAAAFFMGILLHFAFNPKARFDVCIFLTVVAGMFGSLEFSAAVGIVGTIYRSFWLLGLMTSLGVGVDCL